MIIRKANLDDLDVVVDIHLAAFKGFFLSMLGSRFLKELYRAFLLREHGVLLVACSTEGDVLGFAAGTIKPTVFFVKLRKERWFVFLIRAIPGLVKRPIHVLKKLIYAFFYKGDSPSEIHDAALLSSIAVVPSMIGKSVGRGLLKCFEEQAYNYGVKALYLTTDKYHNDRVISFYLRSGFQLEGEYSQPGGRRMLRFVKRLV